MFGRLVRVRVWVMTAVPEPPVTSRSAAALRHAGRRPLPPPRRMGPHGGQDPPEANDEGRQAELQVHIGSAVQGPGAAGAVPTRGAWTGSVADAKQALAINLSPAPRLRQTQRWTGGWADRRSPRLKNEKGPGVSAGPLSCSVELRRNHRADVIAADAARMDRPTSLRGGGLRLGDQSLVRLHSLLGEVRVELAHLRGIGNEGLVGGLHVVRLDLDGLVERLGGSQLLGGGGTLLESLLRVVGKLGGDRLDALGGGAEALTARSTLSFASFWKSSNCAAMVHPLSGAAPCGP